MTQDSSQRRPGRRTRSTTRTDPMAGARFAAEAAYAESIFRHAIHDVAGSIAALEDALRVLPTYAPALLALGSVEYQLGRPERGRELFATLRTLPWEQDLVEIIDKAGDFLIQSKAWLDGFEHYQQAVRRLPRQVVLRQGLGCCAGHLGRHAEAVSASRAAVALAPQDAKLVNDLGWSLFQGGQVEEGCAELERAVAMDPTDTLAANNLLECRAALRRAPSRPRPRPPRTADDRR